MADDKTTNLEKDILKDSKPKISHLLRLFKFVITTSKKMSLIFLGLYILLSLLRPLLALIWSQYIDRATNYLPGGEIIPMILLIVAYYIINFLADLIQRYVSQWENIEQLNVVQLNRFKEQVSAKIYAKLSKINPEYWEVPKINDSVEQVIKFASSDDSNGMNLGVVIEGYIIIAKIISVISISITLFIFNPWLCLAVLIAPLPSFYTVFWAEKVRFKFIKDNTKLQRKAQYYQKLMENTAAKEIKTMGLYDFFFLKWKTVMDEYTIKEKKMYRNNAIIAILNTTITNVTNIATSIAAIILTSLGKITIGSLGAVLQIIKVLVYDTTELFSSCANFLSKKNQAGLFFDVMELKDKISGDKTASSIDKIEIKDVKYRYPLTEKYVLDDINVEINKNEKIALVGINGAGKTSFVKLLTGMITPSLGSVLVNNINSFYFSDSGLYGNMSGVMQNPCRYTIFTVSENVYLGDTLKDISSKKVESSLEFAGLSSLNKNDLLGKEFGGTDLSGGQWQRLAIARACYRDRYFIILDEPTSNLDPINESEIFKKYIELSEDKTVIFVTHRISVAALAKRIIVFDNGKIVEDGTHEELLKENGKYKELYLEQAKWYDR